MKISLKTLIIFFILLNLTFVAAEEITLVSQQTKEYKGIPITLMRVGSSGSIRLQIGPIEKTITKGGAEEIHGLRIRHILSEVGFAKIDVQMIAECLQDTDCDDATPCTKDICQLRECKHKELMGCEIGNECKEIGSISEIDGVLNYCADIGWIERKAYKSPCTHNYECLTNYCDKYCNIPSEMEEYTKTKMAPAWVLIILGILIILISLLFAINPKLGKRISKNIIELVPNKYCRNISIAAIIIAILLIYWALI